MPSACCHPSEDHKCDMMIVYGDTLRALLSSSAVDSTICTHVDGPLESDMPVMFFCKDDLAYHLGDQIHKDDLEHFLALLLDVENLQVEIPLGEDIREVSSNCSSPITMEYGPESDGDPFEDCPDTEPLLPADGDPFRSSSSDEERPVPQGITGEERTPLRSRIASIRPKKSRLPLRDEYHRIPDELPECPPDGDCSTCRKCEKAVEMEW